jgi:hypothetical protein
VIKQQKISMTDLGNTQAESSGIESLFVLNNAHQSHDQTPGKHQDGDPYRGTHHFEDDIARHFQQRVRDEEHGQSNVVFQPHEFQILG